jgi:hypothetical protein
MACRSTTVHLAIARHKPSGYRIQRFIDNATKGHKRFTDFINNWITKYPSLKIYLLHRNKLYFNYLNYHIKD